MGQLQTPDLVLLAISQYSDGKVPYGEREELARTIGRSSITLKKILTSLKKLDLIRKSKSYDGMSFELTENGDERLAGIVQELENYYFTPERHFIPHPVRLIDVINTINSLSYRIFLTNLYFSKDSFDLLETLDTLKLLENETSIYNLITSESMFDAPVGISNFVHSFMDSTMYGTGVDLNENSEQSNYEVLLIDANLRVSRGQLEEGLELYNNVLTMSHLPQDIWFIAVVGKIKTLAKLERGEEMEKVLYETRRAIDNKMALAYLNQIEADILEIAGDLEGAGSLFEKCIGTFRYFNHPIFLSIAYINYGILMFNEERYDDAERLWKQAKRFAMEGGSDYLHAIALTNLASIMRRKGEVKKARKNLEEARKTHSKMKNLEKLSDIEFNVSLLHLSEGEFDSAIEILNRSLLSTYPFLTGDQKNERISVFTRESKKFKYTPKWNGSKFDLIYNG